MLRLAIRVAPEDAEIVLAELLELVPAGVEESGGDGFIEYAVYGAAGELPELPELEAVAGGALVSVSTSEVDPGWADRWREFHRPVEIVGTFWVRPPWEEPRPGLLDLVVDPGQAFGTGAHPTTRLCLELLATVHARGQTGPGSGSEVAEDARAEPGCLDVGCGSGVLAIAAAKLGIGRVVGLDHERESVRATLDNAAANGVAGRVEARRFDLLRDGRLPTAPLVLANLLRPLLLCLARVGFEGTPPRTLIASGLLEHEVDEVAVAFAGSLGLVERQRRSEGGWSALLLAGGEDHA